MVYSSPTFPSILKGLRAAIADVACRSVPAQMALLNFIHGRIGRSFTRFQRLYQRWQTNTLPKPRTQAARKPRTPSQNHPRFDPANPHAIVWAAIGAPPFPLPRARHWLLARLKSASANIYASQLETLLNTPDITQFRAAIPRADRLLRPLCHSLGITLQAPAAPHPEPTPPRRVGAGPPLHAPAPRPSPARTDPDAAPPPILSSG